MVEWYHSVYDKARKIEGASQRVQEDTIKFTRIMEGLGTSLIESIMVLIQFIPILLGLSVGIPIYFFGEWEYGLITGALLWTIGGTIFLIGLGWVLRLVGVEYDLQKKEAAYRKLLVIAEDNNTVRPKKIEDLFEDVKSIHFFSFVRYLYFISCILGNGYFFLMIALFKAQKSVIHLASLFFLGIINEPLIHLLLVPCSKTPILNNFNNSFLKN